MSTTARTQQTAVTTEQVYQIVIKTTPETLWEAITSPSFTAQYFHGARITVTPDAYESRSPEGADWGDGEVFTFDPPRRLVHAWNSRYDSETASEPPSRVSWEIEPREDGLCLLTVVHDHLEHSPRTAQSVTGEGWTTVLSGLKTLLETGAPLRSYA
ncbi:SRPBCC domain-containing protein [Mumia sp. DW29H23]|uniref:SRPBCC domain-containing protein n=1 Tax=Mumia sp. DW29H23 TaxID=3421241 RepID=UPI003D694C71